MRGLVLIVLMLSSSIFLSACNNGDDAQDQPSDQPVTSQCTVHCAP